jgi:hypothetical protein
LVKIDNLDTAPADPGIGSADFPRRRKAPALDEPMMGPRSQRQHGPQLSYDPFAWESLMPLRRVAFIASVSLGVTTAVAQQQREATPAANAHPPVFQGLMVDAKGKTVGRASWDLNGTENVVRQINGVWVVLSVRDLPSGLDTRGIRTRRYLYQSTDCTGTAYLPLTADLGDPIVTSPVFGWALTVPPATAPSIYFAAPPYHVLLMKAVRDAVSNSCDLFRDPPMLAVGTVQSVTVSSLGLTPPFSVK